MGTLQKLLIKRAGMEKAAVNAVSLRNLVANLPLEESIKRFGKKRVAKINEEIENAVTRYNADRKSVNPDYISVIGKRLDLPYSFDSKRLFSVHAHDKMAKNVPLAEQNAKEDAKAREMRRAFKNLFFDQDQFMSREQLLREAKRYGVELNPNDLKHDVYHNVLGAALDSAADVGTTGADIVRLNAQLPQAVGYLTNRLNTAIAGETRLPLMTNRAITEILGNNPKRSIRRALDIVREQNVLEPGTRANRLYNRIVHGAKSSAGLDNILKKIYDGGMFGDAKTMQQIVEQGENAFFTPMTNSLFVAPIGKAARNNVLPHESSHMWWYNLPPEQHLEMARHYLSNLQRSTARNKQLDIPWNNAYLMQEYLADAAASNARKYTASSIPDADAVARINSLNVPDDVRRGLLQLQTNYDYPVFKA